jgi:DNA-binding transcriptional LysR family regulator
MKPSASVLLNRLLARGKFRHLQVLLRVAELGSVQRAADAIGVTQSTVTQTLAYLERLLEERLFQRHARGVTPTPACVDLLPVARQILQGLADGAGALAGRQGSGSGVVRMAASAAAIHGLVRPSMAAFAERHPGIQVQLREAEGEDLLLTVARAEVDLVACRQPAALPGGWTFVPLVQDRFVIVCGANHPLARGPRPDTQTLAHQTWMLAPAESAARQCFDSLAERFAEPPATHPLVTRVIPLMVDALRRSPLLALLPLSVVRPQVDEGVLAVIPLDEAPLLEPVGLLRAEQDEREAAGMLAAHLQAHPAAAGGHRRGTRAN